MQAMLEWTRRKWSANWRLLPIFIAAGSAYWWFLCNGTLEIFAPASFGDVYDSLAAHLLMGRVDVGSEISGEGFFRDGRYYAYFPPAPALPRMLLNSLFKSLYGCWTKLSMFIAMMLTLWVCLRLFRLLRPWRSDSVASDDPTLQHNQEFVFLLSVAFGSTLVFLSSRALVYHEAIVWGATGCLLTVLYAVKYWSSARAGDLVAACLCAGLTFYTRSTTGLCAVTLIGLTALIGLAPDRLRSWIQIPSYCRPPRSHSLAALAFLIATGASFLAYNKARFGEWLDPLPIRYHVQYTQKRLARIQGSLVHIEAIPSNLFVYWIRPGMEMSRRFPWVILWNEPAPMVTPTIAYDNYESTAGIIASMPGLSILLVLGFSAAVLQWRSDARPALLLVSVASGTAALLASVATSERYVHDFFPLIITSAMIGTGLLNSFSPKVFRLMSAVIAAGLLYSLALMPALTFAYQRDFRYGIPDRRQIQLETITTLTTALFKTLLLSYPPHFAEVSETLPATCSPAESVVLRTSWVYICKDTHWFLVPAVPPPRVSPSSGTGLEQTFTFRFPPASQEAYVIFNSVFSSRKSCYVWFSAKQNKLWLESDNGQDVSSGPMGQPGLLTNSQCSIPLEAASQTRSTDGVELAFRVSFQPAWTGKKSLWVSVDALPYYATPEWGTWTVP